MHIRLTFSMNSQNSSCFPHGFFHSPDNLLQLFLLKRTSSRARNRQDLFDKIVKTIDLDRRSVCHGLDCRDDLVDWNVRKGVLAIATPIGFSPFVPCDLAVCFTGVV